ncbi:MAG: DUF4810 domain-containing protein [Campylobacter sp.]|nr:DUF4810 domain-containing protein [Campylobacter sp.]
MRKFALLILVLFLAGCAQKKETLYYWDVDYNVALYEYLNDDGDINKQISDLENYINDAYNKSKPLPPGLNAHLALLYSRLGNTQKSDYYFDEEVKRFPESKHYIDFLKKNKRDKNAK